jgi:hypothetical protein
MSVGGGTASADVVSDRTRGFLQIGGSAAVMGPIGVLVVARGDAEQELVG